MDRLTRWTSRALAGAAALALAAAALAQAQPPPPAAAAAQPGAGGGPPPPPDRSTPVESGELRETWNDRVSQGPPVGAYPGVRRVEPGRRHASAALGACGRGIRRQDLGARRLSAGTAAVRTSSRSTIRRRAAGRSGPPLPTPIHHTHVAAVGGRIYVLGGEIEGASTGQAGKVRGERLDARSGGRRMGGALADADRAGRRRQGGDRRQDLRRRRPPARRLRLRGLRPGDRQMGEASGPADPAQPPGHGRPERQDHRRRRPHRPGRDGRAGRHRSRSTIPRPAAGAAARRFRRRAAGSPAPPMPAACSSSAARASGPTCWA